MVPLGFIPPVSGEKGGLLGATFLFTAVPGGVSGSGDITAIHRDPDHGCSYRWVESCNASGGDCLLFGSHLAHPSIPSLPLSDPPRT